MSVAALEAIALRRALERGEQRLAQRFFRAAGKVVHQAWDLAVGSDLGLPEVEGHRSLGLRLTNAYTERLLRVAEHDPFVAAAFNDVADLLAPPAHVLHPRVLWRVLRGTWGRVPAPAPSPVNGAPLDGLAGGTTPRS
jgi:hypothetical protein